VLFAMQRCQGSTLMLIFHRWVSRTAVANKAKQQLNVCVRRLQQQLVSVVFQQWLRHTITAQRQRVLLSRENHLTAVITSAVLSRCRRRHVAWCWISWRDKHRERMLYETRLRRRMHHSGHFRAASAFRTWISEIAKQRRSRGLITKAARRMHALAIGRAWWCWRDVWRILRRGRRALARMLRRVVSRAFLRWRESAATQQQLDSEALRLKAARIRLELQQKAAVRLAGQARRRNQCRKLLHMWRVMVLSVETKLARALCPLQQALEIEQQRVAAEAEARSRESDRRLQEVCLAPRQADT
jgi:hypothetical protein